MTWAVIAAFSLNSCSKDDDGKKDDPNDPQPQEMRYVKSMTSDRGNNRTFEYDDQHRLSKVTDIEADNKRTYLYSYNGNTVTIKELNKQGDLSNEKVLQLNDKGYVISATDEYDNNYKFTYDADGYLQKEEYKRNNQVQDTYIYRWANGNMVSLTEASANSPTYTTTYRYQADQTLAVNIALFDAFRYYFGEWEAFTLSIFKGKPSANLFTKYDDGDLTISYDYIFDNDGYVSKVSYRETSGNWLDETTTVQITYY